MKKSGRKFSEIMAALIGIALFVCAGAGLGLPLSGVVVAPQPTSGIHASSLFVTPGARARTETMRVQGAYLAALPVPTHLAQTVAAVPEPKILFLFGTGLTLIGLRLGRRVR